MRIHHFVLWRLTGFGQEGVDGSQQRLLVPLRQLVDILALPVRAAGLDDGRALGEFLPAEKFIAETTIPMWLTVGKLEV